MKLLQKITWKSLVVAVLVLGIFWGVALRLIHFGAVPIGTYWDETAIMIDANSVASTGLDMHGNTWLQAIFPSYGDYKLPVFIWFAAALKMVVASPLLATRLPALLVGLLTPILAGLIMIELTASWQIKSRQWFAASAVFVSALSFWGIHFSRVGFEGYLAQFLIGISVLCLLKAKRKPWLWLSAGLLGGVTIFTYYSARFVWPLLWLFFLLPVLRKWVVSIRQKKLRLSFGRLAWPALAAVIFVGALLLMSNSPYYQASQQFRLSSDSILNIAPFVERANQYQAMEGHTLLSKIVFHRNLLQARALLTNMTKNLSPQFLFFTGDSNLRHGTGFFGLFPMIFLPLLLIGLVSLYRHHRASGALLGLWWLTALVPASVPYDVPHALRSLNALIPISLVIAFGLATVIQMRKKWGRALVLSVFAVLFFELVAFTHYYFVEYPSISAPAWQAGYHELADLVWKNQSQLDRVWVNTNDGRTFLWFLADGPLAASEIQKLPWHEYELTQIENIRFEDFVYDPELFPTTPIAIAGKREQLVQNIALAKLTPTAVVPVLDQTGSEQFVVAFFNISQDQLLL